MKHALSLLAGLLLVSTLQAQVYEWFDEAGNRHFSDKKPEGVASRALGDPAANLSSYSPGAIRTPTPAPGDDAGGTGARAENHVSDRAATRNALEVICADYLAQIDAIHDRLRAGYDEPLGNRLRAERSALRAAYRRDCN